MNQSDVPSRFNIPFANNAGASYIRAIPDAHQTPSGSDAPASLFDGFPPECFQTLGAGGIPPNGKDFNGILNRLSAWCRWVAAGSPTIYSSAFSTAIGGYPKGARLTSSVNPGVTWVSLADGNTSDPDGGSPINWAALGGSFGTNANGWFEVKSNGLIYQGGQSRASISEGAYSITFPVQFPTQVLGLQVTGYNSLSSNLRDICMQRGPSTLTGATVYAQWQNDPSDTNHLDGYDWLAVGF